MAMRNTLSIARITSSLVFLVGIGLLIYLSYIFVERVEYADTHQTNGYTTNTEYVLLALSIAFIIFGSAVFLFLLGIKGSVQSTQQLYQAKKKEMLRAMGLGILLFVTIFTKSIVLLIILYLLMRNRELSYIQEFLKRKK
jgi:hypothetical protein